MFILTQDEKTVFNSAYFTYCACNSKGEVFLGYEGGGLLLGKYATEERAKEVVRELFVCVDYSRYEMPIV